LPNRLIGDYEIKNKTDTGGCKVLYATMHELEEAMKGPGLPDVAYILIPPEDTQKSVRQLNEALRQLRGSFANQDIEYQNYAPEVQRGREPPPTLYMPVKELLDQIDKSTTCRLYADGLPPFNSLNISGEKVHMKDSDAVSILELTLLRDLVTAIHLRLKVDVGVGKSATH
jgi:hypothetical protein